jgi:NAD(P)-dependent dehydrogenase (short-subunit alcohol dehydrogenase family)
VGAIGGRRRRRRDLGGLIVDLGVGDRAYLVVGGTRGMGLAAARALAADGARVAIAGRDADRANEVAAALHTETGGAVVALEGDVTLAGEADQLVAKAAEALGGLRGVAITTGLGARGQREMLQGTDEDWMATFDDVLLATVRVCRAAVPVLVDGGGGSIVTTAAYSIRSPKPHQMPYATLKAGVATFTKNLAKSFGSSGVRANCVCPGATETDILASMREPIAKERGWPVEEALERSMAKDWGMKIALGRLGQPQELGDVIAFLLSERASYLTGALINVDGGTDF